MCHEADYDPAISFTPQEVIKVIDETGAMIDNLMNSEVKDRKAFAVWITMKKRTKNEEFEKNKPEWLRSIQDRQKYT